MRVDNKEMLLGLVATLTDRECKDLYYLITERTGGKKSYIEFDRVKLTEGQYNKLIWLWGKEKVIACIDILNKWLIKKNITKPISHYRNIIGWVENEFYRTHPANDKSIRFNSKIDTAWKAKKYIEKIPQELRAYDSEVKFLLNKYGKDVLS